MIPIPESQIKTAISFYQIEIEAFAKSAKERLEKFKKESNKKFNKDERAYLIELINVIEKLVIAEPKKLLQHKKKLGKVPVRLIGKKKVENNRFKDEILKKLNYEKLRSDLLPKFFSKVGIKSCVYCNSMPAISANSYENLQDKSKFEVKAKFQADHSIPKSKYPSLSISLFNLYPVCASCNVVKGDKPVKFNLYSSDLGQISKSEYQFSLKKGCVAKFLISKDPVDLIIQFKDPHKLDRSVISKGSFQDTFDIVGIYETQKDIVEELIYKAEVYNANYKKKLIKSFGRLFTNASLSNRILVGNYVEAKNIHKRPMAKFTQDIAKQLGLF